MQLRLSQGSEGLHLEELWLSEPLLPDVAGRTGISIDPASDLAFTAQGDLAELG